MHGYTMNRREKFYKRRRTWVRSRLEHDERKTKVRKIEFLDKKEGSLTSEEGFRYGNIAVKSRTKVNDKELRIYATSWIETNYWKRKIWSKSEKIFQPPFKLRILQDAGRWKILCRSIHNVCWLSSVSLIQMMFQS